MRDSFRFTRLVLVSLLFMATLMLALLTPEVARSIVGFSSNSPSQRPLPINQYTGVVYLEPMACSGSLLTSGRHILTAAHCITDAGTQVDPNLETLVIFKLPGREVTIPVAQYFIHPKWNGKESDVGADLAVLKLTRSAPRQAQRYRLYRGTDEVGKIFTKVGYGYIGLGAKGQDESSNDRSRRHAGQNRYDALIDIFKPVATETDLSQVLLGGQLIFDFDSGRPSNDTLGIHFPRLANLGLGNNESATGNGDSGGPSFINGEIAAVSSWGYSDRGFFDENQVQIGDIDGINDNGSFGEIFGDMRVSYFARWIDQVIAQSSD